MSDGRWGWTNDPDGLRHPDNRGATPPHTVPPDPAWFTPEPGPTSNWSETLDALATQGQRARSRARATRRTIMAAVLGVVILVVVGVTVLIVYSVSGRSESGASGEWCATGTRGPVTTVSTGGDPTTPTGVVSAFLDAAIADRSASAARATLSEAAAVPTIGQLQEWISDLPATTKGWCAQITTTDSTARLLVDLRVRTGNGVAQVGTRDTFYVSAAEPNRWVIDAIVSGEGS